MTEHRTAHEASALRSYLQIARRRKWLIATCLVLVPVFALLLSLRQEKLYESSAEVFLSRQNLAVSLTPNAQDPNLYADPSRLAETQTKLAQVPAVAQEAVARAGVRGMTGADLLANSSVKPSQNADLLEFDVRDSDPAGAQKLATAYANAFTVYRSQLDTAAIQGAIRDVVRRISALRSQGGNGALISNLSSKEQQLRTYDALQTSNAFVVRNATSASQVQPRTKRNIILAIVLGGALGIGLALVWEALDTRVRSSEELRDRLGIPLLGRIPLVSRARGPVLPMLSDPGEPAAEAFRILRTNLEFTGLAQKPRSLLISSAGTGEGKSTVAANLAIAIARSGKRVLLVDMDLRRPSLHKYFGLSSSSGVTSVALGHDDLDDAVKHVALRRKGATSSPNGNGQAPVLGTLEVLGAGPLPPDPGEFVTSTQVQNLIKELGERADIVIFDAPPLLHVGDAGALSALVDAMVVVISGEQARRPIVNELSRVLDGCPVRKVGFVLVGAEEEEAAYSYYQYEHGAREPEPVA